MKAIGDDLRYAAAVAERGGRTASVRRRAAFAGSLPGICLAGAVGLLYDRGLELVAEVEETGDVASKLAKRRVAVARLRVDLLFDFPILAATLAERATSTRIRAHRFDVASEDDLLRLERIARAERSAPGDVVDISFLEGPCGNVE